MKTLVIGLVMLSGCTTLPDKIEVVKVPRDTTYYLYTDRSQLYDAYLNDGGKLPFCATYFTGAYCLGDGFYTKKNNSIHLMRNGKAWGHELRHLLIEHGMDTTNELNHFKQKRR